MRKETMHNNTSNIVNVHCTFIYVSHTFRLSIWSLNLVSINENLLNDFRIYGCFRVCVCVCDFRHNNAVQHPTHAIIFNWFILFDSLVSLDYSPIYPTVFFLLSIRFLNAELYCCLPSNAHIIYRYTDMRSAHSCDSLKCVYCSMASISLYCRWFHKWDIVSYGWEWLRTIKHILVNWVQGN